MSNKIVLKTLGINVEDLKTFKIAAALNNVSTKNFIENIIINEAKKINETNILNLKKQKL